MSRLASEPLRPSLHFTSMLLPGIAPIVLALAFLPIARGQTAVEINLYFDGAKPNPARKQVARLDSLLNTVDLSRILEINLVGHTDSLFGRANTALAGKRALSVKKLLLERGIPESLITVTAFDAAPPVAEHIISTGRSRNRRVFVRIEYGPANDPAPVE